MHLTRDQIEGHSTQRDDAGIFLSDAVHDEEWRG
jgi:hypothetical protein